MILINLKTGEGRSNVCKSEIARSIGVDEKTISRWCKKRNIEYYHHWIICFNEKKYRQKKGFALK